MKHVLRKGHSSIYLQYDCGGDSMGIEGLVAVAREGLAVISLEVRPVDSNQYSDEERLHTDNLREIHLSDEYSIKNLNNFLASPRVKAQSLTIEITTRGRKLRYSVEEIGPADFAFFPLIVKVME